MPTNKENQIYPKVSNDKNVLIYSKQGSTKGTVSLADLIKARQENSNKKGDD